MSPNELRDVLVVVQHDERGEHSEIEQIVRLPQGAGLVELLREIERESPEIYPEIRERVLRAAGGVLAYGSTGPLLEGITKQLANGGPIVFPMQIGEDTRDSSAVA